MKRRNILIAMIIFFALAVVVQGQFIPGYYYQNDFLMTSPGTFNDGLAGFANPANLSFLRDGELRFNWSTEGTKAGSFQDWGLFLSAPHAGFGMVRRKIGDWNSTDYRISLGIGTDRGSLGMAYGWSKHTIDNLSNEKIFKIGFISRPSRYLSMGLIGDFSFESSARQGVAEIGIRPFGKSQIMFFGDLALQKQTVFKDAPWSIGAVVEPISGISVTGRYFESEAFTVGLMINLGSEAASSQLHYDSDQEYSYNTYSVRVGGLRPSFFPEMIDKDKRYLKISLRGRVSYLGYRFWDRDRIKLLKILNDIKAAGDDPRITAIALNLSDTRIAPEHAWEIREALKEFQKKGKTVVAYIEYTQDRVYHLASVADVIVMDPTSILGIAGYALSRTYIKGTLDKLGLEFDEWRFFRYKSGGETFSRESMSETDREQYQAYVDDWYELTRDDICQSRGMTIDRYEQLINERTIFTSQKAVEFGLVDTLARWSDIDKVMDIIAEKNIRRIGADKLFANALPPEYWGGDPRMAIVYALGECAMNTGIRARWLERQIKRLARDRTIEAIVFRVDSPGGDAMASDVVTQAIKECAARKPVIISQGQVAASGGYWISLYGNKIIAGPNTITGSIGAWGGWIWDKGFSEKIGMSYDRVQRGDHADVMQGVRFPLLGMILPGRNLTDDERQRVESLIMENYEYFISLVAEGRNMPLERVREIAEGRFYSGIDGLENGLVDDIGGLMLAIEIAKQQAGIARQQRVEFVEIPEFAGMIPFRRSISLYGMEVKEPGDDPAVKYIRMLIESPYMALPMLPPGYYPTAE